MPAWLVSPLIEVGNVYLTHPLHATWDVPRSELEIGTRLIDGELDASLNHVFPLASILC